MARVVVFTMAAIVTLACHVQAFTKLTPANPAFDNASAYFNDMEYNETDPNNAAIYLAESDSDVSAALADAYQYYKTIVGKSGAHSYVSLGAAMTKNQAIIDTSSIKGFGDIVVVPCGTARPDPDGLCRAMWVGPGERLYDFYTYLNSTGYIYPGGSCPTVGITGYALGGGIGYWGRYLGYGTDALYDFSLWSVGLGGSVLHYDADTFFRTLPETRLLWAMQGGGNNNFGLVGNLTVRVFQAPPVVTSWAFNSTDPTFCQDLFYTRWQNWNWQSDERLWAQYSFSNPFYNVTEEKHAQHFNGGQLPHWTTFAQSTSVCTITFILMNGTADELMAMVNDTSSWNFGPIWSQLNHTPQPYVGVWYDQICGPTGNLCQPSDLQRPWQTHWTQGTYSAYRFQTMTEGQVSDLFAAMMNQPDPNTVQSFVLFDSLGGQFSRGTGSFPWHAGIFHAQILYYLYPVGDRDQDANGWTWASGVGSVLDQNATVGTGASYVNYPDWNYASTDIQLQRYYGLNLEALRMWKALLDPKGLFPSTAGVGLGSIFADETKPDEQDL